MSSLRNDTLCNLAFQIVTPICGKSKQLLAHAERCQLLRPNNLGSNLLQETLDLNKLHIARNADKENTAAPALSATQQLMPARTLIGPPLKRARTTLLSFGETQGLDAELQSEFNHDFLKLLVANGSPWLFANNPETHIFADKWITPGAVIPDRKQLSGRILDKEVKDVEDRVKLKIQGKVGTGQCDGWKNNAKKSVVSTMVTVENEVRLPHYQANNNLK